MNGRWWMLAVLLVLEVMPTNATFAASRNVSRSEIRQRPITQRPSRPGHFYGNTVRRRHDRRTG